MDIPESIFRAYDIRGVVGETLTAEIVEWIGRAAGSEALARGRRAIIVGRDGRLSSPVLQKALTAGLRATGMEVVNVGMLPSPLVYFAMARLAVDSCIVVTGSHNPADYNGLKITLGGETLTAEAIQRLRRRILDNDLTQAHSAGAARRRSVAAAYLRRVVGDIHLQRPLRVVVDCGNGVAGDIAPRLLRALGCAVTPLYCTVDGRFPNHHPDPSRPENLRDLAARVRAEGADLGLAFDGDGDRLGVVDGAGRPVWPDRLMILFARDILARNPGAEILFDVKCSRHLAQAIRAAGGRPTLWRTGHSFLKQKLRESGALLAGEMSGHLFFAERWYGFDDALYAAARLLEILARDARSPAECFAALPDGVNTPELQIPFAEGRHYDFMARFQAAARFPGAELTTIDGLRADFADGWGLARPSNTTPTLVLRFEGDDAAALERIQALFRAELRKVDETIELPF